MSWTLPADLEAQVQKLWQRGRFLVSAEDGSARFPLSLRFVRPDSGEMSAQFDAVRRWIRALEEGSKSRRGYGYEIEWTEIEHRQLGRNRVPEAIVVRSRDDALRWIDKRRQAERFDKLAASTIEAFPSLTTFVAKKPLILLDHERDWMKILSVLDWFCRHPRSGIYLRQVDLPGVDTKFIESRRGLLFELLDLVLSPEAIDASAGRHFESRYGFLAKRPLVRFRILDPHHRIGGLFDIATPASEFAGLDIRARRIFITENETNGLAFPMVEDAVVIFGLGYGLDRLTEVSWLHSKSIFYWGDIDTHGFAILDRLRASFPNARSLMMNRETLIEHRAMWGREPVRHLGPLVCLHEPERALYEDLRDDRLGQAVRLEQERIGFGWVTRALAELT